LPMRSIFSFAALCFAIAFSSSITRAEVEPGLAAGTAVPSLKLVAATGNSTGKDVDFAAERKALPTYYIFVQADSWERPMARFLKVMEDVAGKAGADCEIVVVWLTNDVQKGKEYLPKAHESMKLMRTTFAVYNGAPAGPDDWRLHGNANVTVFAAKDGKIVGAMGFKSVNEKDVAAVETKLKLKGEEKK
jgi:hypothetical protein